MTHTGNKISAFLNRKPLCFLALLCALRDLSLGVAYVFSLSQVQNTLLYRNYDALAPGIAGYYVGITFILVALLTAIPLLMEKMKLTRVMLRISACLWMFSTFMYIAFGEYLLAIYISGFMMIITGYIGYYFKYAPIWRNQGKVLRDSFIREHDPLTHITDRDRIVKKGESG